MFQRPAIVALALLAAAGCAPHTPVSKPDLRLPAAYEAPAGTADAAALDQWWTRFDDPQLTELITQALAASPDARSALQRLKEARATRSGALTPFLPQGDPGASVAQQHQENSGSGGFIQPSGDLLTGAFQWNVSWELDLFGDIRVARRTANADLAAARFDYEATRMSLAAEVAADLYTARGAAVQLEDARENARLTRRLTDLAGIKVAHGLAASSDTARIDTQAAAAEAEVARLEAVLKASKRSLLLLVGRGTDPLDSLAIEAKVGAAPVPPATTPGELLARRPDVREAQERLASGIGNLKLAKLRLFPNLTLQPGIQLSRNSGAYNTTSQLWSIGVGATVPILDRPKLIADIKAQNARTEATVIAYEKAVQSAYTDTENALTTVAADHVRIERLTQSEASARFAFDAAGKGYAAGLTDLTTLVQAEQAWRNARASLTAVRTAALQDTVTAFKAMGGGWNPDAALGTDVKG